MLNNIFYNLGTKSNTEKWHVMDIKWIGVIYCIVNQITESVNE